MFLTNIPELPPHRQVDFSIELFSGVALVSKAPYMMRILEPTLKFQLKEIIYKGYIKLSLFS